MKVVVFDIMNEPEVIGEITHYENVTVTDNAGFPLWKIKTPVIVTEDGEVLRGYECWWMDYEDFVKVNIINHRRVYN